MNLFDENITKILKLARDQERNRGHAIVNSAAIFIAMLSYKPEGATDKDKDYTVFKNSITKILLKYKIDGKEFKRAYQALYPNGEVLPIEYEIANAKDVESINTFLLKEAQMKMQEENIGDLFSEMLRDPTYSLYLTFNKLSEMRKDDMQDKSEEEVEEMKMPFDVTQLFDDFAQSLSAINVNACTALDQFYPLVTNINEYVKEKKPEIFGFEKELAALETALSRRDRSAALVVGPAGTGKTSLVYKFAEKINSGDVPDDFKNVTIYELHLDAVLAGSMFRGQFEQKLMTILEAAKSITPKYVILFIDEFHTITSAGGNNGGDVNASNIIKPYITRGEISLIGASTNEEINSFVEKDKAISRRFAKILINEPSDEETTQIINKLIPSVEESYGKKISDEIRDEIIKASSQYNIQVANPDRSITMLENTAAFAKNKYPDAKELTKEMVYDAITTIYNVSATSTKYKDTESELHNKILGEDTALSEILQSLKMVEYNIINPKKPKSVLIFAGPTGTGKTESAKIIAKYYTGSEKNLITVSGSSLMDKTSTSALFGTNAGYIGFEPTSPFLAQVKQNPNCVVLFDEIEKADKDIFRSLLQILDEGVVEDKIGNKISFRNAIIIFTTNLGFGTSAYSGSGMMATITNSNSALREIKEYFSPEFLGRVNKVVTFDRLSDDVTKTLIERYRDKYEKYSNHKVSFDEEAIERIRKAANIKLLGARILEDAVRNEFLNQIEMNENK